MPLAALQALHADWPSLPPDEFLKDGGRYRRRRHSCFVADGSGLRQVPHRAHWQPLDYNALHGGMQRWFAPMQDATVSLPAWQKLLAALAGLSQQALAEGPERWFLEAHQFRIDTTDGIGRPTPEGAHRDGVDLVAVFLVGREGGEGRGNPHLRGGGAQRPPLHPQRALVAHAAGRCPHDPRNHAHPAPGGMRRASATRSW